MNKYLEILSEAWRDHLARRAADAPTVISTFAGCGGSSLGYSMAGFRELLAIEWDDNAAETFRINFPEIPVYQGDIAKITVEQILEMTGLQPGQLDVLDGSPPCQGFSTAGKRAMEDPRNQLFLEYVRLLRGLKPKVFVMENVSGMVKGKMKLIFAEILRELKASGYRVSAKLLNAMYFQVPQSRERLIFIGVRNDFEIEPSHPAAIRRPFTTREAFSELEDFCDRPLSDVVAEYARYHPFGKCNTDPEIYRKIKGSLGGCSSVKWARWNGPLMTIIKTEIEVTGIVHPDRGRYLNTRELSRCGSFPDGFVFLDRKSAVVRIGNSVPPLFMRAIATHVRKEILQKINQLTHGGNHAP